jgi:F0F1-type ATP synthase membrane subunit b/b'
VRNQRFWIPPLLVLLFAAAALHLGAQPVENHETRLDSVSWLKFFNTGLFFAFLGWLIYKYAPKFFQARSLTIQKAIEEATGLKIEAEFRHSEIDRKMATLPEEIRKLRAQEAAERQRDHSRFQRETENAIAHLWRNAEAEIEAYWLQGMRRVRERTADLALQFAEQHVPQRFGPRQSEQSVRDVIHLVNREDHKGGKSA